MTTFVLIIVLKMGYGVASVTVPGYTDLTECNKAKNMAIVATSYVTETFCIIGPSK